MFGSATLRSLVIFVVTGLDMVAQFASFKKLKLFLSSFMIKADEAIQTKSIDSIVHYTYQVRLHE